LHNGVRGAGKPHPLGGSNHESSTTVSMILLMPTNSEIFILSASALLFAACASPDEPATPIESDNPEITFVISGGFWGGRQTLLIDPSGLASIKTIYPVLSLQLSSAQLDSIISLLAGFDNYRDSYPATAIDAYHFTIVLKTPQRQKSVEIDEFAFEKNPELALLRQAINMCAKLEYRIYSEKADWIGLEYTFGLGDASYASTDSILILCNVANPTNLRRTLYFRNQYALQFGFSSVSYDPHIEAWVPDQVSAWADTVNPHQVSFDPGERRIISFSWNQSFVNYSRESYSSLPAGDYTGVVYLLAGPSISGATPGAHGISFHISN
jgi:hypothetical protein